MIYRSVAGVTKDVSQIVLGTLFAKDVDAASPVFDYFVEQGGNCFDTARHYGDAELIFGEWMRRNGNRDESVVITKGAHTPNCNPESVTSQLSESLERLQTDFIDIYFLHRDNPDVPVGEFVDVLNEHKEAGRLGILGGSNWSPERMDEANAYATRNGFAGFTVLSNHMSLARMEEVPWEGCLASSDAKSRRWLAEREMPLFPWSSQAQGFFVDGRADPSNLSDPEFVRCWYSDDNFERLFRARQMAKKLNVLPLSIALAYVLHQPTPTFPLIGPVTVTEAKTSMAALKIQLTLADMRWLNLEDE
jgi:aryl-alcohol dehydrogenase-like predicted oxidoreductase